MIEAYGPDWSAGLRRGRTTSCVPGSMSRSRLRAADEIAGSISGET